MLRRITPRPEDFVPTRVKPASARLIAAANRIFETEKFSELRTINLTRGVGNKAFVLRVAQNPAMYHSEKQFSLGELCILKLVRDLENCPNHSLVLIDELEMALHPRVQLQLYNYLREMADNKRLTVIFSTHSVSLLKGVPHRKIIFLQRDDDSVVTPVVGCFPTYALGNITLGEERAPDAVLYVEDEVARWTVEPLVKLVLQNRFASDSLFPAVKVVPIGTFDAVVRFLSQHTSMLPASTSACALLDNDVQAENVAGWRQQGNHEQLARFQRLGEKIEYLPWTPEVGIVEYIAQNRVRAERAFRSHFNDNQIQIDQRLLSGFAGLTGAPRRNQAKRTYRALCDSFADLLATNAENVGQGICEVFATHYFAENSPQVMRLLASKIS